MKGDYITHDLVETRLAEIEAYCQAATAGPWVLGPRIPNALVVGPGRRVITQLNGPPEPQLHNGTFITKARSDLPASLAVVRTAAALLYDAPWIPESTQVRPYAERVYLALALFAGQEEG
jgi:hypothetical protein